MEEIGRGAEAVVYLDNGRIIKDRLAKGYRIRSLDQKLRKARTKKEAKILEKLAMIKVLAPRLIGKDLDNMVLTMEYIKGQKLSDALETLDYRKILRSVGRTIARLHDSDIIHGDLTTSNMIYQMIASSTVQ